MHFNAMGIIAEKKPSNLSALEQQIHSAPHHTPPCMSSYFSYFYCFHSFFFIQSVHIIVTGIFHRGPKDPGPIMALQDMNVLFLNAIAYTNLLANIHKHRYNYMFIALNWFSTTRLSNRNNDQLYVSTMLIFYRLL